VELTEKLFGLDLEIDMEKRGRATIPYFFLAIRNRPRNWNSGIRKNISTAYRSGVQLVNEIKTRLSCISLL
jgi:hypothetical protein